MHWCNSKEQQRIAYMLRKWQVSLCPFATPANWTFAEQFD
jgi:hypothetical protein